MEFESYLKQSELDQMLGFYNLEEISFHLQDLLFTQNFVPFKVSTHKTISELFREQFNFSLSGHNLERGMFRLFHYSPSFHYQAHQFLFFENDYLDLYSLDKELKYRFKGVEFMAWKESRILVASIIPPGSYLFKVSPGPLRRELNKYLTRLDPLEWDKKSELSFSLNHLFSKYASVEIIRKIISWREEFLGVKMPDFDFKKIGQVDSFYRWNYIINHYEIPPVKITHSRSALVIRKCVENFTTYQENCVLVRAQKSPVSYEHDLKRFISKLRHLSRRVVPL